MAVFLRRFYYTIRNVTNYLQFIIPLAVLFISVIIVNHIDMHQPLEYNEKSLKLAVLGMFVTIAFCFNSSVYVILGVYEREYNLKSVLNAMGCRNLPYWTGTLLFDYLIYFCTISFFLILCSIFRYDYVIENMGQIVLMLASFGLPYVTFSYMFGFVFKKSNTALKVFPIFNFFITWLLGYLF